MNELIHSPVVTALCWTLLHSLWQGMLAAVIAGGIRLSTKNATAAIRHNSLALLFVLLFAASMITYVYEWTNLVVNTRASWSAHISNDQPYFSAHLPGAQLTVSGLCAWVSAHANWIVSLWLLILLLKTAKISFTIGYTAYISAYKSVEAVAYWRKKINQLGDRLHINKPVALLESGLVRLPIVFGHFKPVIFVPLGLLARLSAEQVEAILLHELAHIRRNDYLVNLFQCLVETLFFFNPAILWLSALIREEREYCCDDLAIEQTGSRKQYVETLISFKENVLNCPAYRPAVFPGFSSSLPARVRRIATRQNLTLTVTEKGSLACGCLVAALLLLVMAGPRQNQLPAPNKTTAAEFPIGRVVDDMSNDLLDAGIIRKKSNLSFALTNTAFVVNGRKQPPALWKKFNTKYLETSPYPIRPEHRTEPGFGIFFNAVTHVYGIGTRPPAWGT